MQVRIRGLGQCDSNTKTGKNMITLAERAVNEQVQIAQKLKEIALRATDDTYNDVDREVLQSETTQMLMQMNAISYETNYNGQQLLCLATPGDRVTVFDSGGDVIDNTVDGVVPAENGSDSRAGLRGYSPSPYTYVSGTVYDPASIVYTPMASVSGLTPGSTIYDSSGTASTVVSYPSTGLLVVMDPSSGAYIPIVDSSGRDSSGVSASGPTFIAHSAGYAPVASPTVGMTVTTRPAVGSTPYTYDIEPFSGRPIAVSQVTMPADASKYRTDSGYSYEKFDLSGVSAATLPDDMDNQGFSLLCRDCGQFVSIKFDAKMPAGTGQHHIAEDGSEAFVVGIKGMTTTADIEKAVMDGLADAVGASAGTSTVMITNRSHSLYMREYTDSSGVTSYYITKDNGPRLVLYNGFKGEIKDIGGRFPYGDLFIQGDTKSSQNTRLQFPNTTLDILFPSEDSDWDIEPTEDDYPAEWPSEYDSLSTEDEKREKWRDEVWPYPRKGAVASASCVRTRKDANKFLEDIDQALNYLLHAATNLGAQAQRMDVMNDNIVTAHENTQGAESTIRDADMAKEMATYTKNNVLSQTAQSMLSQANQNIGGTLDLLQ